MKNHIKRNMVLDCLADLGSDLELGLIVYHDSTDRIRSFMDEDVLGVSRPLVILYFFRL